MKLSLPTRIVDVIVALLFIVFAWFQRNDIDPEVYYKPSSLDAALWLGFYLLIGILAIVVIFRKIPTWILVLAVLACVIEMGRSGPGLYQNLFGDKTFTMTQTSMTAEDPRVELSREFFGALIAMLAVIWIGVQHRFVGKRA